MRVAEIIRLRGGDLHLDHDPTIEWIGKKNRARKVAIGPVMLALLTDYLTRYRDGLSRELVSGDFLVCRQKTGGGVGLISWGRPFKQPASIAKLVQLRADEAGLGHMSPHDLRRSAAGILHRAVSEDGAHYFGPFGFQRGVMVGSRSQLGWPA
jgi:integrase